MQRNILISMVLGLVLLAGLWGYIFSQSTRNNQTSTTPSSTLVPIGGAPPTEIPTQAPEITTVKINSGGFSPQQITIKKGEAVTWINDDTMQHQVNSAPHPEHTDYSPLNSIGLLNSGAQKSLTFPDAGTYHYHDHLNPQLFGAVVVR